MASRLRIDVWRHLLRKVPVYQDPRAIVRDQDVPCAHVPMQNLSPLVRHRVSCDEDER